MMPTLAIEMLNAEIHKSHVLIEEWEGTVAHYESEVLSYKLLLATEQEKLWQMQQVVQAYEGGV